MALGLIGLLDLSIVTDRLVTLLKNATASSPLGLAFPINVSGSAPDSVRQSGICELSLYLFHVSADKHQRNSPVTPPRLPPPFPNDPRAQTQVPVIPFQPLSLDLYYLLTAFAASDYVHEQQVMSVALKCFHENPIVRTNVTIEGNSVPEEFCLTMEVETADELSRIWQAASPPARLSVVYKVSVVFITPEAPTRAIAPPVEEISIVAAPATLPFAESGQVLTTYRRVSYRGPDSSIRSFDQSPATVAAGERVLLIGAGLNGPASSRAFLLAPDGSEFEVTPWMVPQPPLPAPPIQTSSRITLELPGTVGALPAPSSVLTETPPAGVYQLRVGDSTDRSNATPVSIAARLTIPAGPPQPILSPAGADFTFDGLGFIAGRTEVLLGGVRLNEVAPPGAGEFGINPAGTQITFEVPTGLAAGLYPVRVRVNNVESAPTWWVQVP